MSGSSLPQFSNGIFSAELKGRLKDDRSMTSFGVATLVGVGGWVAAVSLLGLLAGPGFLLEGPAVILGILGFIYAYAMYDSSMRKAFKRWFGESTGIGIIARLSTAMIALTYAWTSHDAVFTLSTLLPDSELWFAVALPGALVVVGLGLALKYYVRSSEIAYSVVAPDDQGADHANMGKDNSGQKDVSPKQKLYFLPTFGAIFNAVLNALMILTMGLAFTSAPIWIIVAAALFAGLGSSGNTYYRIQETYGHQNTASDALGSGEVGSSEKEQVSPSSKLPVMLIIGYVVLGFFENITLAELMGIYPELMVGGGTHHAFLVTVLTVWSLAIVGALVLGALSKMSAVNGEPSQKNWLTWSSALLTTVALLLAPVVVSLLLPAWSLGITAAVTAFSLGVMGVCTYAFYYHMEKDALDNTMSNSENSLQLKSSSLAKQVMVATPAFAMGLAGTAFIVEPDILASTTGHQSELSRYYPDDLGDAVWLQVLAWCFILLSAYLLYRVNFDTLVSHGNAEEDSDMAWLFDRASQWFEACLSACPSSSGDYRPSDSSTSDFN